MGQDSSTEYNAFFLLCPYSGFGLLFSPRLTHTREGRAEEFAYKGVWPGSVGLVAQPFDQARSWGGKKKRNLIPDTFSVGMMEGRGGLMLRSKGDGKQEKCWHNGLKRRFVILPTAFHASSPWWIQRMERLPCMVKSSTILSLHYPPFYIFFATLSLL